MVTPRQGKEDHVGYGACARIDERANYCNPDLEKIYEKLSVEPDHENLKQFVWEIDRRLQEDAARAIVYQPPALRRSLARVVDVAGRADR